VKNFVFATVFIYQSYLVFELQNTGFVQAYALENFCPTNVIFYLLPDEAVANGRLQHAQAGYIELKRPENEAKQLSPSRGRLSSLKKWSTREIYSSKIDNAEGTSRRLLCCDGVAPCRVDRTISNV